MAPVLPYPMRLHLHPMEHPIPEFCHVERVRDKTPQIVNTVGALDMGIDVTRNWGRLYFAVTLSAAQELVSERIIRSPLALSPIFAVPQHVANRALHDGRHRKMAREARSEQKWLQTENRPGVMLNGMSFLDFVPKTSTPQNTLSMCVHTGLEWAGTQPSTNQKAVANAARLQ